MEIENYEIGEKSVYLQINTKVYSFEVILATLRPYLEQNYIVLDGDRHNIVEVEIKPKRKVDMKELADQIFNRLFMYNIHEINQKENKEIIDNIMKNTLNKYNEQRK